MLNRVILSGRLIRDPEIRYTQSGVAAANFCIAVDRDFRNKETGERQADFLDCVAWKGTAEFLQKFFHKGSGIIVDGKIQTRTYEDKDGNRRKVVEVKVDSVYFAGSKPEQRQEHSGLGGMKKETDDAIYEAAMSAFDSQEDMPF